MSKIEILIFSIFLLLGVVFLIYLFSIVKTLFYRNKEKKVLNIKENNEELSKIYADKLYDLLKIKTTSYETGEAYHVFREKVKELFPLVHKYFVKEKLGPNAIFTYKSKKENSKNVLIVTHIDTTKDIIDAKITNNEIYGSGAFDSKALFFVVLQSIEEYLAQNEKFDIDLTVVMTVDDISTKEGNERIVNKFLKQGSFFHLVIEEGVGIIDPIYFKMRSHYALLGIGVTGEVKIRYKVLKTRGISVLEEYIEDITKNKIFKSQIDKNTIKILNTLSKDMPFKNRLLFSNIWLYKPLVKKMNDNDTSDFSNLLKTHFHKLNYQEDDNYYYTDLVFELATHDTTAEIVGLLSPYVKKHGIEYELKMVKDPSKVTSMSMEGYKVVKKAIFSTYKDLYVAPYIINKIAEQRYLSRVSDCVIRYSPLYYPYQALEDAKKNEEHIMKKSLIYGINFYKNIFHYYEED